MAEEENLVSRRPRRSTAGNRMELALAELAEEDPQEVDEDVDFVVEKDEEDIFESDFASTDDEAAQEDVEEGDKAVRDEERRELKTARSRLEKATAAAHARQKVTFNPEASFSQPRSKPKEKLKRKVSLGLAVNAETGEVIEGSGLGSGTVGAKRHSQRRHTVMNTSATVNRMKDAEEKRAAVPKKVKTITRLPTQDELMKRALDNEEGNILEHRDYLRLEEEKRAKARVVRQAIEGPLLRWISRKETIQVEVPLPPAPPTTSNGAQLYAAKYSFVYNPGMVPGATGTQAYSMPFYAYAPPVPQSTTPKPRETSSSANFGESTGPSQSAPPGESGVTPVAATAGSSVGPTPPAVPSPSLSASSPTVLAPTTSTSVTPSPLPVPPQPQVQAQLPSQQQLSSRSQTPSQPQPTPPQTQAQPQSQGPVFFSYPTSPNSRPTAYRPEDVCKNYVVHELSQYVPSRPLWKDTMAAMFGDHVKWEDLKVFTGKGRPLARPVRVCPITGLPARYRDPRTNVPFANVGAYQVLSEVLGREYVWCHVLGCYVGTDERSTRGKGGGGGAEGGQRDIVGDQDLEGPIQKRRKVEVETG